MTKFEIIKKNNKPFVRMTSGNYQVDMMIYATKTDKPYIKYMSGFMGKVYLTEELKVDLTKLFSI